MADTIAKSPAKDETPLDHMEEELRHLEGDDKAKWGKWVFIGVLALAAILAYTLTGRHASSPVTTNTAQQGVLIDMQEPAQGKLATAPRQFRWESVAGRNQYFFTLTREKDPTPLVQRGVRNNSLELTSDEASKLVGGAYVWRVEALDKSGAKLGSGQSRFSL